MARVASCISSRSGDSCSMSATTSSIAAPTRRSRFQLTILKAVSGGAANSVVTSPLTGGASAISGASARVGFIAVPDRLASAGLPPPRFKRVARRSVRCRDAQRSWLP